MSRWCEYPFGYEGDKVQWTIALGPMHLRVYPSGGKLRADCGEAQVYSVELQASDATSALTEALRLVERAISQRLEAVRAVLRDEVEPVLVPPGTEPPKEGR